MIAGFRVWLSMHKNYAASSELWWWDYRHEARAARASPNVSRAGVVDCALQARGQYHEQTIPQTVFVSIRCGWVPLTGAGDGPKKEGLCEEAKA